MWVCVTTACLCINFDLQCNGAHCVSLEWKFSHVTTFCLFVFSSSFPCFYQRWSLSFRPGRKDVSTDGRLLWSFQIKTWLPGSWFLSCAHSFTISTHQSLLFSPIFFSRCCTCLCFCQVHCSSSPWPLPHSLDHLCRALALSLWDQRRACVK